jgi:hypothetical protein
VLARGVEHFLKNKGEPHTLGAQTSCPHQGIPGEPLFLFLDNIMYNMYTKVIIFVKQMGGRPGRSYWK